MNNIEIGMLLLSPLVWFVITAAIKAGMTKEATGELKVAVRVLALLVLMAIWGLYFIFFG